MGKHSYYDECYKIHLDVKERSWRLLTKMKSIRSYAASSDVDGRLFIAGGYYDGNTTSTTEFIRYE